MIGSDPCRYNAFGLAFAKGWGEGGIEGSRDGGTEKMEGWKKKGKEIERDRGEIGVEDRGRQDILKSDRKTLR